VLRLASTLNESEAENMENFENKAICPSGQIINPDGPFDVCLDCPHRAVACSGPRTTAMSHERYVAWLKRLFAKWGGTRQQLAHIARVSKSSIDDLFAGRRKDISRMTAGLLEDALIGGDSKWPCAMWLDSDKEIVYQDRPETLEALRINMEANQEKDAQIIGMQQSIEELKADHEKMVAQLKAEHADDIKEYRELVAHLRTQIDRKDDYIDRLAKKAGL
jgi:hypothetical protein